MMNIANIIKEPIISFELDEYGEWWQLSSINGRLVNTGLLQIWISKKDFSFSEANRIISDFLKNTKETPKSGTKKLADMVLYVHYDPSLGERSVTIVRQLGDEK